MINTINDIRMVPINWKRFDFLLAILVMLVWIRIILYMRGFKQFGPIFRAVQAMVIDLFTFMGIWILIIIAFACVAVLIFGKLPTFTTLT